VLPVFPVRGSGSSQPAGSGGAVIDPEAANRPVTAGVQDVHQVTCDAHGDRQVSAGGDDLPLTEVGGVDGEDGTGDGSAETSGGNRPVSLRCPSRPLLYTMIALLVSSLVSTKTAPCSARSPGGDADAVATGARPTARAAAARANAAAAGGRKFKVDPLGE